MWLMKFQKLNQSPRVSRGYWTMVTVALGQDEGYDLSTLSDLSSAYGNFYFSFYFKRISCDFPMNHFLPLCH
ncbi:hypothetical protein NC652_030394 [Populus alba x Populus x berolinensis]|nr:hypothetical protein NC652_030394 [Populus alba x Populus x berolinensis]